MMWNSSSFKKNYSLKNGSILHGKFDTYNVSSYSGLIIKNQYDLKITENIIKGNNNSYKIKYDKLLKKTNVQNKKKFK